ncbi:MAG: 4Fe-4S dicluster domain-containing protein [Candidatus Krumholzibacteria bacterium]|nr:4Fe-4S dicluster domain-containing protein [Candidatus Krumholzibacteria bacterium]
MDIGNSAPRAGIDVDRGACIACGACSAVCPAEALVIVGLTLEVFPERCRPCGLAALVCPTGALRCPGPEPSERIL